jgi:hypothetical protein
MSAVTVYWFLLDQSVNWSGFYDLILNAHEIFIFHLAWLLHMADCNKCNVHRIDSFHCAWYLKTIILKRSGLCAYYNVSNSKQLTFQSNTVPPSSGSSSWITLGLLDPSDERNMLHQNIVNYLPADVAPQHLRRPKSSSTPLSQAQVEQYVYSSHSMEWFTVQPLCLTALHIAQLEERCHNSKNAHVELCPQEIRLRPLCT